MTGAHMNMARRVRFSLPIESAEKVLMTELAEECTCHVQFPLVKVADGKYKVGYSRTTVLVRVLRDRLMVRVGGGWTTLREYLNKRDPCRCQPKGKSACGDKPTIKDTNTDTVLFKKYQEMEVLFQEYLEQELSSFKKDSDDESGYFD